MHGKDSARRLIETSRKTALVGMLCAVLATCFWSGNFIVARSLNEHIPPATLSFLRWSVAVCLVLPLGFSSLRRDWRLVRQHLPLLLATALLGVTFFNTLLYKGAHSTSALNLALISTTFPVFIILFSRFFYGEPVTTRRFLGTTMAVVGVVALVSDGDLQRLANLSFKEGDLWMLLAAVDFAVYSMLVKRRPPEMEQFSFLVVTFCAGLIMLCPWMVWEQAQAPFPEFTLEMAAAVCYVGLFASLGAYFCWNKSVMTIGPVKAGLIYYTLPVFSGVEAWAILGEPLTLLHAASGACIIGGIVAATYVPSRQLREKVPS